MATAIAGAALDAVFVVHVGPADAAPAAAYVRPTVLSEAADVAGVPFFARGAALEVLRVCATRLAFAAPRHAVSVMDDADSGRVVSVLFEGDAAVVAVTNKAYPQRVCVALLREGGAAVAAAAGKPAELRQVAPALLAGYANVAKVDAIARVQAQLDDTKQVLHKTIEQLLGRGETLDSLVAKSGELSDAADRFRKKARKTRGCCVLM
jgi:synaptobrevin family protein YKT6